MVQQVISRGLWHSFHSRFNQFVSLWKKIILSPREHHVLCHKISPCFQYCNIFCCVSYRNPCILIHTASPDSCKYKALTLMLDATKTNALVLLHFWELKKWRVLHFYNFLHTTQCCKWFKKTKKKLQPANSEEWYYQPVHYII